MIQSQAELERSTLTLSAERIRLRIEQNENKGRANENAYAQPIYRRWVLPLRDLVTTTLTEEMAKAGRRQAHVALLKPLDPSTAAFMAVRITLVNLALDNSTTARVLASAIGTALHRELVLSVFENIEPDLYYEVTNDLDRRKSKQDRHRYNALMGAARNKGMEFPTWQQQDREQLGMWFVEALRVLGLIEVSRHREGGMSRIKEVLSVDFTPEAERLMSKVNDLVEINSPMHAPCIEQPKDWVAFNDGGWHTNEMRQVMPFCVNIRRVRNIDLLDRIKKSDLTQHVLPAINQLQRVRWAINTGMLNTLRDLSRSSMDLEEALQEKGPDAPERPDWLLPQGDEKQVMTEEQEAEFKQWKRSMARWHTERKLRGQRWGRFRMATMVADKFKGYEAIYFVYQADFRGRLYAQTVGVNPQGSDMQKALLHFADGKALDTPDAVRWFKINGANRYGKDKVTFEERVKWVDDNDKFLLGFADDPVGNNEWTEADQPLQFLAWAKEYAAWRRDPNFVSRIPVGLDGSCNGLQHFSAMLRDGVGGKATNLLAATKPNDIYAQVAQVTQAKLSALNLDSLPERDQLFTKLWLQHGMNRTLVKRSVMTLPYGSTRFSCAEFIVQDYLRHGLATEFEPGQYQSAANYLSHVVWESIGEVVVAASNAMAWLQKSARTLINNGHQQIEWTTPSGFPVTQVYNEREEIRINAKLFGGCRLWVHKPIDEPKLSGHKNGLAPNFVHSMDASHLMLTVNACQDAQINSLAMIHDDYGTHAADTQKLYETIRSTFVEMYEKHDPIMDFFHNNSSLPTPPARGGLQLRSVLESPFFFA